MRTLFLKVVSLFVVLTLIINILPLNAFASTVTNVEANTQNENQTQNNAVLSAESIMSDDSLQMTDAFILYENEEKRSEFSKDFLLSNGLSLAAVYPYAVHFEEDGQWKEIDHTLTSVVERGTAVYKNKAGAWDVYFPQTLTSQNSVSVSKDGYKLSFGMAGELRVSNVPFVPGGAVIASVAGDTTAETFALSAAQNSIAQIQETNIQSVKQGSEFPETVCDKASSRLLYADVYSNTSIIYDLLGNQIKESIIIRSYDANLRGYRYALNTGSMIPVLQEDGSIVMYTPDRQEVVFTMPAPYMVDSNGEYSGDVNITLSGCDGSYTLTYVLPTAWLADEARAWPVILDPIVDAESSTSNIADRTVAEERTLASNWGMNACGYRAGWGIHRFYMKFIDLPTLGIADNIVHAEVTIYDPYNPDTYSVVEVHEVLSTWTSSGMTWANAPGYNETVSNFIHVTSSGYYTIDVTDLARGWYESENTGMVFKMSNAVEQAGVDDWKQFYSCEYGSIKPTLQITYRNINGLEDYWDYTTSSAGRAGTGYVNTLTGNLTWVHNDIGFGGNRMPVSISHIYNANDSATNAFGMGYGWRTNFNQTVAEVDDDNSNASYVWEDGDGTKHYFVSATGGTYVDEDNLGLTLTVTGTTITVADKLDNSSVFTNGRLAYIYNNQNPENGRSAITIEYNPSDLISCVKDGAGRAYNFTYSNGLLTKISYTGTGTTEVSYITFGYSNSRLTTVTYKDAKTVTYGYSENILTSAKDIDGYKIKYSYATDYHRRVNKVQEYSGSLLGRSLSITYSNHQTKIIDDEGNYQLLQFNDWGNLVATHDNLGHTQYSKYALNDAQDSITDAKRLNQVVERFAKNGTAINFLTDSSFENGTNWNSYSGWYVSAIATGTAYHGDASLKLSGASGGECRVIGSSFFIGVGETYTFSAYVLPQAGAKATLGFVTSSYTVLSSSVLEEAPNTWVRLQVSYTNEGQSAVMVFPHITVNTGVMYVDCVQLERANAASEYNLLENGEFRSTTGWTTNTNCTTADHYYGDMATATEALEAGVFLMTGNPTAEKSISQDVVISGEAGDVLVLSGWAKADAVPLTGNRKFGLKLTFHNTGSNNSATTEYYTSFDADISSQNWQYATLTGIATTTYDKVTIELIYGYQSNTVYFDGIQLLTNRISTIYTYDTYGNIETETDVLGIKTRYTYDTENHVDYDSIMVSTGQSYGYVYDDFHNVTKLVESVSDQNGIYEMTVSDYTYDAYGNLLTSITQTGTIKKKILYAYEQDNNRLSSITDETGKTTTYFYNPDTNVLEWVRYPEDTASTQTNYEYDNMHRLQKITVVTDRGKTMSASYTYDNDLLKTIQTKGDTNRTTLYSFDYLTKFSLREKVKVGTQTLVSYTYTDDENHYLQSVDYSNGDKVQYTYDDQGRLEKEEYLENGSSTVSRRIEYTYDNSGAVATVKDSLTGNSTVIYYDFAGRVVKHVEYSDTVDEDGVPDYYHVVMNVPNNDGTIDAVWEYANGMDFSSFYTYDREKRVKTVKNSHYLISSTKTSFAYANYTYDAFDRITKRIIQAGEEEGSTKSYRTVLTDTIAYSTTATNQTSDQVKTLTTTANSYSKTYTYSYDDNGNILSDGSSTYVYDSANQLIRENNAAAGKTWTWEYDGAGNILYKKEYAYTTGTLGTATSTIAYTYGNSNWGDLLTAYNGNQLTYDSVGNVLSDGSCYYSWKQGRQLATMYKGGTTWTFTYNTEGMRTKRAAGATAYTYVYSGSQLTHMTYNSTTLDFAYDANGRPMTVRYNGATYYYVLNLQGDVVAILNSSGAAVVQYTYDAWGKPLTTTGSMASTLGVHNPLRYRGYVYDTETDLYYLQSRYYNPVWGRFINADALVSTGQGILGNNMFAYCGNNPVNLVDPNGEFAITISTLILIGSAIVGAACAGYTAYVEYNAGFDTAQIIGDSICAGFAGFSIAYTGGMSLYQCYQNYCYLNSLTPVTNISSSPSQTTLYRSVSTAEAQHIQETGQFSIAPGGMESKQFGFDLAETKQFGSLVGQNTVVSATLPTNSLNQFCTVNVDATIFQSGTLTVYSEQLDTFNRLIAGTIVFVK